MTRILAALCAFSLTACSPVQKTDARTNYQKSVEDYGACLDANPNNPRACEDKRVAMEAAYHDMAAGVTHDDIHTKNAIEPGRRF